MQIVVKVVKFNWIIFPEVLTVQQFKVKVVKFFEVLMVQ